MVQYGCVIMPIILFIGSFVYFVGSRYMKGDLKKLEKILNGNFEQSVERKSIQQYAELYATSGRSWPDKRSSK